MASHREPESGSEDDSHRPRKDLFHPDKTFANSAQASHNLLQNRNKASQTLQLAKEKQIGSFKQALGSAVKQDHGITLMPHVRIDGTKSSAKQSLNNYNQIKRVPVAKYAAENYKNTNVH
jgi:hypothetical protein